MRLVIASEAEQSSINLQRRIASSQSASFGGALRISETASSAMSDDRETE